MFDVCPINGTRQTKPLLCLVLPSGVRRRRRLRHVPSRVCRVLGAHGELANSDSDVYGSIILSLSMKVHGQWYGQGCSRVGPK